MADNRAEKEINLLELAQKLWDKKKFIIKVTLVGAVIGLIIAFSIPKEYTTTVVFTTNSNSTQTGNMGALASLAGFNIGNSQSSDIFSPDLYPNIISSTAFIRGTFSIDVKDNSLGVDTTLYDYLKDYQKTAWWNVVLAIPSKFLSLFQSNNDIVDVDEERIVNNFTISREEMSVINILKNSYSIVTDKKTSLSSFHISMQDPTVTAFLADTLTKYLQSYIINERTRKAKTDLENTKKLYQKSIIDYEEKQKKLASFLDRNKNIISAQYGINQKKLENEVSLAYSVYTQMAQQYQLAQIKVQDNTPVFTVIQPAVEPLYPSVPNKKIIVIGFMFFLMFGAMIWVLKFDLWNVWNNND